MLRKLRLPSPAMVRRAPGARHRDHRNGDRRRRRPARQARVDCRQGEGRDERAEAQWTDGHADRRNAWSGDGRCNVQWPVGRSDREYTGPGELAAWECTITYRSQSWSVNNEKELARDTASCLPGEKVIGGGWDEATGVVLTLRDNPLPDGSGWRVHMFAESGNDLPASGTMWAVCLKVS